MQLYNKVTIHSYIDRDYIVTNDNSQEKSTNQRTSLPVAILHGDLFLENILFQLNGELDAVVDWECISIGERLSASAFLSSYQNILSLTSSERKYFEMFLRYSLLSIACYRWYRFNVRFPADHRSTSYLTILKRANTSYSQKLHFPASSCDPESLTISSGKPETTLSLTHMPQTGIPYS
jgi:Ser/Thr protein kinase RdoA (MazF antagonist)